MSIVWSLTSSRPEQLSFLTGRRWGAGLVLLLFLVYCSQWGVASQQIASDFPVYPGSMQVNAHVDAQPRDWTLVTGMLKKVNNRVMAESELYVVATRESRTYFVTGEERVERVKTYYQTQLAALGEIVFSCSGRECGRSNHWANDIFGDPLLYGPEAAQQYTLLRLADDGVSYLQAYIAQRGNGKIYVRVEILRQSQSGNRQVPAARPPDIAMGRKVSEGNDQWKWSPVTSETDFNKLVAAIRDLDRPVFLLGSVSGAKTLPSNEGIPLTSSQLIAWMNERTDQSEGLAEQLKQKLVARGIRKERLITRGLGPFSAAIAGVADDTAWVLVVDSGLFK